MADGRWSMVATPQLRSAELVAWLLTFERGDDLAHPDGWDDGVDADVSDLDDGQFAYRGRLRVEWLSGQDAQLHQERYGW